MHSGKKQLIFDQLLRWLEFEEKRCQSTIQTEFSVFFNLLRTEIFPLKSTFVFILKPSVYKVFHSKSNGENPDPLK